MKKMLLIGLPVLVVCALILVFILKGKSKNETPKTNQNTKLLINELELNKRPFIAMIPHPSGRLLSLYLDNIPSEAKSSTLDIEYLAGNLLKGGRISLNLPVDTPYIQAFLLGSCSAGGKCSFDKNLVSGTLKHRIEFAKETHILKSNYVFINGEKVSTSDTKASFDPANKKQANLILIDSQGLPASLQDEAASSPFIITSVTDKPVKGKLILRAKQAGKALIYNGNSYEEIPINSNQDGLVTLTINHSPWQKTAQIIRDDQQGKQEEVSVNVLGPIILTK